MIGQNTAFPLSIKITNKDGSPLDMDRVEVIELTIDSTSYYYRKNDAANRLLIDPNRTGYFIIILNQEDTVKFKKDQVPVQVRVKFSNGTVVPSKIGYKNIAKCLSEVIL